MSGDASASDEQPELLNMFGIKDIPNSAIQAIDVPVADIHYWLIIEEFALTFDAYTYWGSFGVCASIANASLRHWQETGELPNNISILRTCLFFEQRRWRHFEEQPDGEGMVYITAILTTLRRILTSIDACDGRQRP